MKKTFTILICTVLIAVVAISFVACGGVQRNVDSVTCLSSRGDGVTFAISAKKALIGNHSWWIDGSTQLTSMASKMRSSASNTYDYEQILGANNEVVAYHIYSRYSSKPASFLLRTTSDYGDVGFEMFSEEAKCAFNPQLAFPAHLLQDVSGVKVTDLYVEYGSAFVVDATIQDVKDFYEKNNYTVELNDDVLTISDNLPYSGSGDSRFKLEFDDISAGKNLMTFKRTY